MWVTRTAPRACRWTRACPRGATSQAGVGGQDERTCDFRKQTACGYSRLSAVSGFDDCSLASPVMAGFDGQGRLQAYGHPPEASATKFLRLPLCFG
jgi:hypothetical protein